MNEVKEEIRKLKIELKAYSMNYQSELLNIERKIENLEYDLKKQSEPPKPNWQKLIEDWKKDPVGLGVKACIPAYLKEGIFIWPTFITKIHNNFIYGYYQNRDGQIIQRLNVKCNAIAHLSTQNITIPTPEELPLLQQLEEKILKKMLEDNPDGVKVMVKGLNGNELEWHPRYLCRVDYNDKYTPYVCYDAGCTKFSDPYHTVSWQQFRLPTQEELNGK